MSRREGLAPCCLRVIAVRTGTALAQTLPQVFDDLAERQEVEGRGQASHFIEVGHPQLCPSKLPLCI